jgi:hypothetical protein
MAVAHLLDGVGCQHPRGVDGAGVQICPVVRVTGLGQLGDLLKGGHESRSWDV